MCQGEFLSKNADEAESYFDWLAENAPQWEKEEMNRTEKIKSLYQLQSEEELVIKYEELARKVEAMAVEKANPPIKKKIPCETCQMIGHSTIECPNIPVYQETTPAKMNAVNN